MPYQGMTPDEAAEERLACRGRDRVVLGSLAVLAACAGTIAAAWAAGRTWTGVAVVAGTAAALYAVTRLAGRPGKRH